MFGNVLDSVAYGIRDLVVISSSSGCHKALDLISDLDNVIRQWWGSQLDGVVGRPEESSGRRQISLALSL